MSSAASTLPLEARSAISPRRQQADNYTELPHRSASTMSRSTANQNLPRGDSYTQSHSIHIPSSRQNNLANLPRRDYEQSNLAQIPSRSSPSKDAYNGDNSGSQGDHPRTSRRTSSKSGHARYNSDATAPAAPSSNGVTTPQPARAPSSTNNAPRRRTTVTAQTGQWALGKTIGQGSMGKVKLARNLETGEQVRCSNPHGSSCDN